MNSLPVGLNIKNKNILLIGSGEPVDTLLEYLIRFTEKITVLGNGLRGHITFSKPIEIIDDRYHEKYLNGMFLVFAYTGSKDIDNKIYDDARSMGILCCIVGNKEKSDFHFPDLVSTTEGYIAVHTENQNKPKIGIQSQLASQLEAFCTETSALDKEKLQNKGKVFLVGFGPGDPRLITKRGEQLLFQADYIFYDDLLDANALARYKGEKVYVGKRRDNHSKEQEEINDVLFQAAKKGHMVVRLKGGDPFIFGRGGEEKDYLTAKGIEVEIIPGISSAIAAAASSKIPLTYRGISSSVAFGTAHGNNSYRILESDTSVYFMGAKNMQQIASNYIDEGYSKDLPVGLVQNVSLDNQKIIKTTIGTLAKGEIEMESPLIIIVGNTVKL